jgi:hypothetical protein
MNKNGTFEAGDIVNDILRIRKEGTEYVEFLVNWKKRRCGTIPYPSWVEVNKVKLFAPETLCEYLFSKI